SVFVRQRRTKRVALHVRVVALFKSSNQSSEFSIPCNLTVDLGVELPTRLAKRVGREKETRRGADRLERLDRGIRKLRVSQVVGNKQHEARHGVLELVQTVLDDVQR